MVKKIESVILICENEPSEDELLSNYATGHMMGGFWGMVQADILNSYEGLTTTFLIKYENGTSEYRTVKNSSLEYRRLIKYI